MQAQFDDVSVVKKANVYFDGKCISHTVILKDGTQKTLGVILPASLTFTTKAPEIMELQSGKCRIRLNGEEDWNEYKGGQSFVVPGNSSFEIDILETLDYICHYS